MPDMCGSLLIQVDGLSSDTKTNPGLLVIVIRNFASNGAPRKKVTFYGGSCSSTTDCLITCTKPNKLRLWDSATGGNVVPWNQHYAIQSIKSGKELYLEGLEASATTGDILVRLVQAPNSSTDCYCNSDEFKVTVLWCDVSARFGVGDQVSMANDKRAYYHSITNTYQLNISTWPGNNTAQAGIELVGAMKPSDFNTSTWGVSTWVRYIINDGQYSGVGGTTPIDNKAPGSDDTAAASQDINPQPWGHYLRPGLTCHHLASDHTIERCMASQN